MNKAYSSILVNRLAGRYDKPYAGVNYIPPVRDYEFGYWLKFQGDGSGRQAAVGKYIGIAAKK